MTAAIDLTGHKYGRLSVVRLHGRTQHGDKRWLCRCDCGNEKIVQGNNLRNQHTMSCGCLNTETHTTHGMYHTKIYKVWHGMKSRCVNRSHSAWEYYGGRGVEICQKWMDFEGFYEDMGCSYKDGLTIDRRNNDGNYCKKNCRWVPQEAQKRNTRHNVFLEYKGEVKCLKEWSEIIGLAYPMLQKRISRGWQTERAFETCSQR
jgi:hypothetical protein